MLWGSRVYQAGEGGASARSQGGGWGAAGEGHWNPFVYLSPWSLEKATGLHRKP